jgi:hypothetical protein
MATELQIPLDEVIRVFRFLEKAHDLMHQPITYQDLRQVEDFVNANYSELRELYYRVVWNWLPENVRTDIEDGGTEYDV